MRADSGASARSRSPSAADRAIVAAAAASAARSAPASRAASRSSSVRATPRLALTQLAPEIALHVLGAQDPGHVQRSGRSSRSALREGLELLGHHEVERRPVQSLAVVELARHPAGELRAVVAGQRIGAARDRRGERRKTAGARLDRDQAGPAERTQRGLRRLEVARLHRRDERDVDARRGV